MNSPANVAVPKPKSPVAGIFLLIVGVVSLLVSGLFSASAAIQMGNDDIIERTIADSTPDQKRALESFGDPKEVLKAWMSGVLIMGLVSIALGLAMIAGGICLMTGSSRAIAITGGVAAVLPTFCCLLNFPIGVWAIVAAIRMKATTPPDQPPTTDQVFQAESVDN